MHPDRSRYRAGRGYLAACTLGLPALETERAVAADLERWASGRASAADYSAVLERARGHAAALLGVRPEEVATGSQTSALVAVAAAAAPHGAEIVCAHGDFSSIVAPFLARGGLRVRHVPVDALADAIGPETWLVSYSLVQSATGELADARAIARAAREAGALVLCDVTQAAGWMPVTGVDADLLVCHAYKWLSAPRGAAFAAFSARAVREFAPLQAGWYSGEDPWASCYGPELHLAAGARRFDVSPAWHAWVGAEIALGLAASADLEATRAHDLALANAFRARLGLAPADSAIVAWPDADGSALAALGEAGVVASGRAGRARVAFHVWNDEDDVELAARALGR